MSVKAMTWAFDAKVGDNTRKMILLALANFANDQHECWPSQSTLAELAECSVDTVQRALKKMERDGFIVSSRRHKENGHRSSNLYRLNVGSLSRKMRSNPKPHNSAVRPKPHLEAGLSMPHMDAVESFISEPSESMGLVDRPVSSNSTEQAATFAAAPKSELVGKEETGTYSRLVKKTAVNQDTAQVNRDVFGPDIASSALAQLSARIDAGEAIRNPTLIFTRICEDLRREAARGVKPLTEDEKLEAYFRAQAKREGRQYMGRG